VDINTASGQAAGISDEKFAQLAEYAASPLFTPLERMVLAYADTMTISGRDTDDAAFDGLFQINVKAPFFLVAALAPKIAARGGGSIINVSTMVASYGQPGMAAYGASRAAIELLTKAWAAEYGPQNVRVNAVAPGPTLTPSVEPMLEMATEFAKTLPLGRLGDVHELSDVITFLATPSAGYINGAIIPVDGGRRAI